MSESTPVGFETVLAEMLQQEEAGQAPDVEDYCRRFPELAPALRDYFADRQDFEARAQALASVAGPKPQVDPALAGGPAPAPGDRFAGHDLLEEIGHGGMGVVFHARQLRPSREVALKLIRRDRLEYLSPDERRQWVERFRREVEFVAALDRHPNLMTLYEAGEEEGHTYFTMQLVRGGSLSDRLFTGPMGDPRAAAQLVVKVARAVDHAHQRGVLHRDLKPANILLDDNGEPLVSDFGLGRRVADTGSLSAAALIGTPSYMAPEQARPTPGGITVRTDVYGLGAVLYEILTGVPPFRGADPLDTLMQVIEKEPVPPRRHNPRVDRDLETICLKCLQKDPARRYASAMALADDLENWLAGRPITARPIGVAERVVKYIRRQPLVAGLGLLIFAVAAAGVVTTWSQYRRVVSEKEFAEEETRQKDIALGRATKAEEEASAGAEEAKRQAREARREATRLTYQQGQTLCERGEVARGMHAFAHGLTLALEAEAPDLDRALRAQLALWGQHLHTLRSVLPHSTGVAAVAFSPDGKTVVTAEWDRTTRLWDTATGKPRGEPVRHEDWVTGLSFSPDGQALLTVEPKRVGVWTVATGGRRGEISGGESYTSAAFTPDGRAVLVAGGGGAQLWDAATLKPLAPPLAYRGWVEAVACASAEALDQPEGMLLATGSPNGLILLWNAATPGASPVGRFYHPQGLASLALSRDGRFLLSGGEDRTARLWDLSRREAVATLPHQGVVKTVAFTPDGGLALTGSLDRTARLWDTTTGQPVGQPLLHQGEVLSVAVAGDGRSIATGQGRERGDARLWNVALAGPRGRAMTHKGRLLALAMSPDGKRIATAGADHNARLWDAVTAEPVGEGLPHNDEVNAVAFRPDGAVLVSGSDDGDALFWQAADGRPVVREGRDPARFRFQLGVSSRGPLHDRPGSPPWEPAVQDGIPLWEPARGKMGANRQGEGPSVHVLAFSPDGKRLATGLRSGEAFVWDAEQGARAPRVRLAEQRVLPEAGDPFARAARQAVYAVAFSPDGRLVAVAGEDGAARVWEAVPNPKEYIVTGRLVAGPLRHDGPVMAVAFNSDGTTLLTAGADRTARLWDVSTGKPRGAPLAHQGAVVAAVFSPSGETVATADWERTARLWRTRTGELAAPPLLHQGRVLSVAFSPDGRAVVTASEDGTARLWDTLTGQPLGPALTHPPSVHSAAFRPDGRAVVTAGETSAQLWPVPVPLQDTEERITRWLEATTGTARDDAGIVFLLPEEERSRASTRLVELGGSLDLPDDRAGWHLREAAAAESDGRAGVAAWHLDQLLTMTKDGLLHLRRGRVSLRLGQRKDALRHFEQAAEVSPDAWEPPFELARLEMGAGRGDKAVSLATKALERFPKRLVPLHGLEPQRSTSAILHLRGSAQASLDRWQEATEDLEQAVKLDDATVAARADLVILLTRGGDAKKQAAYCRSMVEKFTDPRDEQKATVVTKEFGRRDVYQFGKPFDPQAAARIAWACAVCGDAEAARALTLARRAASSAPEDYVFARALGAALLRAGDTASALKQLETAQGLRKQPAPSVLLLLALAHAKGGRADAAKEQLSRGRDWIEAAKKHEKDVPPWEQVPWAERVALEALLREAEKGTAVPANPKEGDSK